MKVEPCARIVAPVMALPSFAEWGKAKAQCQRCKHVHIEDVNHEIRGVYTILRCTKETADPVVRKRVRGGYCIDARTDGVCSKGQLFEAADA